MPVETPEAPPRATDATPSTATLCSHCGLPVPAGLVVPGAAGQFCCSGCRTAYAIIHDGGLGDYYVFRDRCDDAPKPIETAAEDVEQFDDPEFVTRHVATDANGRKRVRLGLRGLHCAACVWLVEKLPRLAPGVLEVRVSLVRSTVDLTWDPERVTLSRIATVIGGLGYHVHPLGDDAADDRDAENRRQLLRLAVAGACAGNAMLIAFALYAGMFSGMAAEFDLLFRLAGTAVGLVAIAWPGSVFFRGARNAIRLRTPHMDVPVALGLGVGGVAGLVNAVTGRGETYFDTLALLVFLLLVGRYLMFRGQQKALDRVSLLHALTPRIARKLDAVGTPRAVSASTLRPGDLVEVRAGEVVPADGEIVEGQSSLDESLLTGESVGRAVRPRDSVPAGAANLSARLLVRVTAIGAESRIGRVMSLVESASRERPPIVLFADRISGWFVLTVLALTAVTLVLWWPTGWERAIDNAVALLIVACPCALGLATPLTLAVMQGRAAKRSILVKTAGVPERLAKPGRIWLDKTGTLTEGRMALRDWAGSAELKPLVAAFEAHVAHPIADALTKSLGNARSETLRVTDVRTVTGGGVVGFVNGREIAIGSERFVLGYASRVCTDVLRQVPGWLDAGCTPIYVAADGRIAAAAAVGDAIRSEAEASVAELIRLGWKVGILSGDHPAVVAAVARHVGIEPNEARGGLSPEDKLWIVEASRAEGNVVMVGDGVNDSAALAAASVGVAVHGGAEVSLRAADVYTGRPGLTPFVELVRGGRRTVRIIRSIFAASLTYNLVAVGLAMTGHVNPLVAAVLMPISSLTVLAFALGGRTFPSSSSAEPA
jgi:Cu2+-exporting ATPase